MTPNLVITDTEFGQLDAVVVQSAPFSLDLHSASSGDLLPGFTINQSGTEYVEFVTSPLSQVLPDVTTTLTLANYKTCCCWYCWYSRTA